MKTQLTPGTGSRRVNFHSLVRLAAIISVIGVIGIPLFSSSSASSSKNNGRMSQPSAGENRGTLSPRSASTFLPLAIAQPSPETITTFAADCTTPKTSFILGETVCAQTEFVTETNRFVNFCANCPTIDYGGPGITDITTNQPQNFLYTPNVTGTWKATIADPSDSSIIPTVFTVTSPISTYAPDCVTAKSSFNLGDVVCAKVSNINLAFSRRFSWVDPAGYARQVTPITTSNQTDSYTLPATQTSFVGVFVVDNRGTWKVNVISSRNSVVFSHAFLVKGATPTADLSLVKSINGGNPDTGTNFSYNVAIKNAGPSDATNVVFTDPTPANATFVAANQISGPVFNCTGSSTVVCTRASFAAGDTTVLRLTYTAGAAGSSITNVASVSSDTAELNNGDNSASSGAVTVGSGSGGGVTCSISCPEDIVTQSNTIDPNNPNQPGAVIHFDAPITQGTCGTVTISHCNDCFFPQGTTVVTATASGGDSCSFSVTVSAQSNAPTISCPPNKVVDANGDCQAEVTVGNPTTSGGQNVTVVGVRSDGRPMYNCDANGNNCVRKNPDLPFPGGVTTITWTATSHDSTGAEIGSASCTQTITVNNASDDTTAPVITCPANITRGNDAGQCSAAVNVGTATATDNCDSSPDVVGTRSDNQPLSAAYPKGTTTITWTATDAAGNHSSCQQTVTVNDTESPIISCPANMTANTETGTCAAHVNPGTATATDNCDTSITITGTRSDGQPLTATYPKGTTTITWKATDASNNHSECQQMITVEDHEAPVIVCPANITQGNDPGTCSATVNPGQPTTSDNCDTPTVTGTRDDDQALNAPYPKGTTIITWTATDGSDNQSSCTQTITVVDNEAPTFTFTGTQTMWPPNHKYRTFPMTALVASVHDNCDGDIPVSSVVITKVTSDEIENGNGDGNTLNDIVIAADCKSVQLRGEREGNSNGRVYTIFFSVTDAAGNVGTGVTKVVVPHNPGETAVDSGPHYTVTSNCP